MVTAQDPVRSSQLFLCFRQPAGLETLLLNLPGAISEHWTSTKTRQGQNKAASEQTDTRTQRTSCSGQELK